MTTTTTRVAELVVPLLPEGVALYDVLHEGGTLRVLLDRDGGIDVGTLTEATRRISAALDEADPIGGPYTLEVSSPGMERPLRTPEHFAAVVGRQVRVKCLPGTEVGRRHSGELVDATDTSVTVRTQEGELRTIPLERISSANVAVDWTPPPKPGRAPSQRRDGDRTPGHRSEAES